MAISNDSPLQSPTPDMDSSNSTPYLEIFSPDQSESSGTGSPVTDSHNNPYFSGFTPSEFPRTSVEPVAIIGFGCRWPGDVESGKDVESDSALWDFLKSNKDSYGEFPPDRINVDSWYHPDTNHPGAFYSRGGCFLKDDPRKLDHTFFGINPQEASTLDPAQRKLLEVVYEAFESAGVPLEKLSGSDTGCYVGNFNFDHQLMQYRDLEYPEPYCSTGGGIAILSNRISYVFNLHGPSLTLDTACSSSMYALHLACSAIQAGDISAAVVAGSNLILSPEAQVFTSALGAVSKSSQCHTFDATADGYARADGVGALYIKSLKQAIADNDPIRAIIRATAINSNGRTSGIAHPDASGQEAVIRKAYERAGDLDPALTGYFECHGTGTPVGDPLEVEAVARVFAGNRSPDNPLFIGSIKSNMGHCEPASGIAGIMKTTLALENGIIPPNRGITKLNPNVDLKDGRLKVVQENTPWPINGIRRASVNSFGYGGANAHTILESPDILAPGSRAVKAKAALEGPPDAAEPSSRELFLLPFSAHNEVTLRNNINALQEKADSWELADLAYTLSTRRSQFSNRSFSIVENGGVADSLDLSTMIVQKVPASGETRIGYVFTGQGAQWPQMGAELMDQFPVYLKSIRDMDSALACLPVPPQWTIEAMLKAPSDTSQVYEAAVSQPLTTAVQVALVDLLSSWDIEPTGVVGHSSGEIAAVYAAGRISARDAIVTAHLRGVSVSLNKADGLMLAVGVGSKEILPYLDSYSSVNIACHNSPQSITLSGDRVQIQRLKETLDVEGIFARIVATGGNAYHSQHMSALGLDYETDLLKVLPSASEKSKSSLRPMAEFVSSVTGAEHSKVVTARYWRRNLESPVLFHQALEQLTKTSKIDVLIEIGPHSALQGPVRQISKTYDGTKFPEYIPTLVRNSNGTKCLLDTAGKLFLKGYKVDLGRVNAVEQLFGKRNAIRTIRAGRTIVDLPKYQWNYGKVLYRENRWTREFRLKSHPRHDILGSRMPGGNRNAPTWRNVLRHKDLPWLNDHKVGDDAVFPTSAYLSMCIEAVRQMTELAAVDQSSIRSFNFADIEINAALIVPEDDAGVEVLLSLYPVTSVSRSTEVSDWYFSVSSVTKTETGDVFTEHVRGKAGYLRESSAQDYSWEHPASTKLRAISSTRWYDAFARVGLNYGPTFQNLSQIKVHGDTQTVQSEIGLQSTAKLLPHESRYIIHPAPLDSALQLIIVAAHRARFSECKTGFLPVSIKQLQVYPFEQGDVSFTTAESSYSGNQDLLAKVLMSTGTGQRMLKAEGIRLLVTESSTSTQPEVERSPFASLIWKPDFGHLTQAKLHRLYPSQLASRDDEELPLLDQLALHQLIQFYSEYSHFFEQGSDVPQNQRLLNWITEKVSLCKEAGIPQGTQILAYSIEHRATEIGRLEQTLLEHEGPETRLLCHMYRSLPAIYRGELSGIQAAIQDHHLDDMYANMKMYHDGNSALKDVVELLSHKNPRLKIIEIGGGTGSATRVVLPALRGHMADRGYESYTFTDVGPAFLAGAQESFKDYNGVIYRSFNMEKSPSEQGLDNDFDLVIASNVLHASSDIKNTMLNCRGLLKPGGKLAIFEYVEAKLSWNMILGTFSDFWLGDNDPHFPRSDGPFMTRSTWNKVLPSSGFNGVDFMLDHFSKRGEAAIIMATASSGVEEQPEKHLPRLQDQVTVIHRGEPSEFVLRFQDYLQMQGASTALQALESLGDLHGRRVISLVELEGPLFTTITGTEWEALKQVVLTSSSTLWVTRGGLVKGQHPEFAMFSGMAGVIRSENPSCRLFLLDLDRNGDIAQEDLENIFQLSRQAEESMPEDDFNFVSAGGLVHVSRLYSHDKLNSFSPNNERRAASESDSAQSEDIYELSIDPEATYLLVGGLGGLGRSFAKWMVEKGAKNLMFLSRSGVSGIDAADFISELESLQVNVQVEKGDVSCMEDVLRAIDSCIKPIKGVIQAPLSLQDAFFSEMTLSAFQSSTAPRIQGTLNLHIALQSSPLDFFIMWSSWATLLGSASQSNYTASNAFMDAFARYRRSLNLPATSLCLGQILDVGIVSHMPAYQEHVLRMGMYGNTEAEFLSYCEAAIRTSKPNGTKSDEDNNAHLLVGLEPAGLLANNLRYPISDMPWTQDPRFSRIYGAINNAVSARSADAKGPGVTGPEDDNAAPLINRIHKQVARLLYVPVDDVDVAKPINSYGIDSMVAAELRNWLLRAFKAHISLLNLLSPGMTIEKLKGEVETLMSRAD